MASNCCSPKTAFVIRVIYASVGIVVGLIICAVFNVVFDNRGAAYLGLSSSLFATACLFHFIYLHVRTEVQQKQPHLYVACLFGIIGAIGIGLGLGALVIFLGLGIIDSINHKDLPLPRTHYIAVVWAFGNFKWGLTAFLYALKTFKILFRPNTGFQRLHGDPVPINEEAAEA